VTSSADTSVAGQSVAITATVSASGGYTESSTFEGPAELALSDGGRWTTSLNPKTTVPFQSDGNHQILVSRSGQPGVARYRQVLTDNQYAQATITTRGGSTLEGVLVRVQSDTNPSAIGLVDFGGQWYSLVRFDNATNEFRLIQTSDSFNGGRLADFAVVPKVGDVMRVEISGDTVTAYVNGTLLGSVVDTQQSDGNGTYGTLAGGLPGVYGFKAGGSVNPALSDFSAGDIDAPTSTAVPTGSITFIDGEAVLGTVNLNGAGQATLDIPTLSVGSHSIVAVYSGDANFVGSAAVRGHVVKGH
jgi:hypothetical protein